MVGVEYARCVLADGDVGALAIADGVTHRGLLIVLNVIFRRPWKPTLLSIRQWPLRNRKRLLLPIILINHSNTY